MKFLLASTAALAFMAASATACPFDKTAEHHTMSVASIEPVEPPMSTAEDAAAVDDVTTGAIKTDGTEEAE